MIPYKDKMSKILTFSVGIIKYYYMTVFFLSAGCHKHT